MKTILVKSGKVILFSVVIAALTACTEVFFRPMKSHLASPEQYSISYEDIYFKGKSGLDLHGWWFPAAGGNPKGSVLYLHGNGENISTHSGMIHWLTDYQYDVFIFDYRGYGKSAGEPEFPGVMLDIVSAVEYVNSRKLADKKLIVIGHSLGASLGIYSLAKYKPPVDAMIFVSPFSDYRKVAREMIGKFWLSWIFQWPASLLISTEYNPLDVVGELPDAPKLFIYSEDDQTINYSHVINLYENASGEKSIEKIDGHHNFVFALEVNQQLIVDYLDRWVK